MHRLFVTALAVSSVGLLAGGITACSSNNAGMPDSGVNAPDSGSGGADAMTMTLTFNLTGVPDLGTKYMYEGWLVDSSGPHSTGKFSVASDGTMTPSSFQVDAALVQSAQKVVITIEPQPDPSPMPSMTHFLAGDLSSGNATLTISDPKALGTDFSSATGKYVLNTPSTPNTSSDYNQGIWWLVPGTTKTAGLSLPTLPAGWKYEGWVVGASGPISTGKFTMASGADSDGAGSTAGPGTMIPPFPGQDFINPATTLDNTYKAVITVEPDPDNSPMPFAIKPLVDPSIDGTVMPPATQDMSAGPAAPSGTATIQ